jgi:hypothetical protein
VTYGPPKFARAAQMGRFAGDAFIPQPDGMLRCPTDRPLYAQERRPERNGSVRVLYGARLDINLFGLPRTLAAFLGLSTIGERGNNGSLS